MFIISLTINKENNQEARFEIVKRYLETLGGSCLYDLNSYSLQSYLNDHQFQNSNIVFLKSMLSVNDSLSISVLV